MAVKPIPDGYHAVTPYVTVRGADKVIEFLRKAFDAEMTHEPLKRPDGSIMHAEVKIGDSRVMLADESDQAKASAGTFYLYVNDADAAYHRAVKAGGKSVMDLGAGQFADRSRLFTIASDDMGFSRSRFPAMTSNDPPCRPTAAASPPSPGATPATSRPSS